MASADDIDELLVGIERGDAASVEALTTSLYGEMQRLAAHYMRRERASHTLEPAALVNEAFLRLAGQRELAWRNRGQVLGIAARVMRRVLVDHARARDREKRGGLVERVSFDTNRLGAAEPDLDLVALESALVELAALDEQLVRVVELRYFAGLSVEETAGALGISRRSVDRAWATARAWLRRRVDASDAP
jgi:RNA polymerase sigma factor (TIGR02999 family)